MGFGRQVLKHSIIYSLGTVLGRLCGFLMLPVYSHIFMAEGYGIIAIIDTSLGMFSILLGGGYQGAILRIYHEKKSEDKLRTLSTGVGLIWILGALLISIPFVFSPYISNFVLGSADYYSFFCFALVSLLVDVAGQSASTSQIIKQQSVLFTSINLVKLIIGLLLNIWLIIYLKIGLIAFFLSSLVTAIIGSSIFHILAFKEHGFKFDYHIARQLLQFQVPLLPGDIISFLGRQAELIIVRIMIGIKGVGILDMAYKFPPLINLFITIPFLRAWRTKSIEMAEQKDAPYIISIMFTRYLFMVVFVGLLIGVTIEEVLRIITPPEFWQAAFITKIEILTTIINGSMTYLSFGIIYSKKTGFLSLIKLILVPFKIFFSFLFIFLWGLGGAAFSALLIEFLTLFFIVKRAQALYPLPLEYWKIVFIIFSALVLFLVLETNNFLYKAIVFYITEQYVSPIAIALESVIFKSYELGKIILLIQEKKDDVISLILNMFFAFSFLIFLPFIYKPVLPQNTEK